MIDTKKKTYQLDSFANDPLNAYLYTLPNGLRLYMSVNKDEPRIFTNIAVRAGSKQDPPETTGLAHYMEHMLFKGTSRIGATDWDKEKQYLDQIAGLYEKHRRTRDPEERRAIYREIDRLSFEAAKLVAPNEYDRLLSSMGAKMTNAYTYVEQTVFVNDIPANELCRWMELEAERFRMMALRLFHTELETVYEEFNIGQDQDIRKVTKAIREGLFPEHPYGTQTTIGSAEHLRNPSMKNIQTYFQTYYVPNNMAIILAGDFDPQEAVALAEKHFGHYAAAEVPPFTYREQPAQDGPVVKEVLGKEAPLVTLSWRLGHSQSEDPLYATVIQQLLFNEKAGLLDLELNQQQKVLESDAWVWMLENYTVFGFYGRARQDQSLEAVVDLLLDQLERIKSGDFPDWMLEAVINDLKLNDQKQYEDNQARVNNMTNSFILGIPWPEYTSYLEKLKTFSKADIVRFARERLDDQYVVVYKREGEDPNVIKVDKPPITSVELNRDALSEYGRNFLHKTTAELEPTFVDFKATIRRQKLNDHVELACVHNPNNELFTLSYEFDFGKLHDRAFALALNYLPYLGTEKYTPLELQQELFRLGLSLNAEAGEYRSAIILSGLEDSFAEGLKLLEHVIAHVTPNEVALGNFVQDILSKRDHAKQDRDFILRRAFASYARYGASSPFSHRLSREELLSIEADQLTSKIHRILTYPHRIYYFGPQDPSQLERTMRSQHFFPENYRQAPAETMFTQLPTAIDKILFLDYPIVQTDVMQFSKGTPEFSLEEYAMKELFNDYFGFGLSSIVFQEIRESRGLAYSTFAYYSSPGRKHLAHYLQAYVGTQPDKLEDAIPAMRDIMGNMPINEEQIDQARRSILKQVASERISPRHIHRTAINFQDLGYDYDLRQYLYETMESTKPSDLVDFHRQYVRGRAYTYLVLGSKDRIDMNYLRSLGPMEELQLEDIFGY